MGTNNTALLVSSKQTLCYVCRLSVRHTNISDPCARYAGTVHRVPRRILVHNLTLAEFLGRRRKKEGWWKKKTRSKCSQVISFPTRSTAADRIVGLRDVYGKAAKLK